ncbi:response regulator [Lacticaseibacillus zhaodongensis]|uniref:response regulator n=1 Tax=Lacticaseibacillus zhaodongensis TaxID=2668065 RepID=UPI0012D2E95E|nr:response regulator transcription factor [Lacticaseibacillus zhaodongensis]
MIKVLIVDDHEMVRLGISSYLGVQDDLEVAGEAENGQEGLDMALKLRPDVILMDLVMPKMNGVDATKKILKAWPAARVIILTSFIDDELVYPAMEAGAASYILKTSTAEEIADAIRQTAKGQTVLEPEVSSKIQNRGKAMADIALYDDLTSREREVLRLIAQGKSNQEIADELFITLKTVKTHVSNILAKLEVDDRTKAAIYAFKHGIVKPSGDDDDDGHTAAV